jgi:membrane associated rhomboid family serine protease
VTGYTTNDPSTAGPIDRPTAERLLARGDELVATGDYGSALAHFGRVIGFPEPEITAAAFLGSGEALYRLDRDGEAVAAWEAVTKLPETRSTYPALRQIAAARVRAGELRRALEAYRAAEHLAPPADRPEIASRLGWLSKELGDPRAAGKYFARSRGSEAMPYVSYGILGITVVVSLLAFQVPEGDLLARLELDKRLLAAGEWWRLVSPALVHGSILHLFFNMYFLYIVGPLVEQLYGSWRFLLMYVLTGAGGSVASYLFGSPNPSVGASGAIFGLCGVLLAVSWVHKPVLDRRGRALMSQIGMLVVLNLVLGFGIAGVGGGIDNLAHLGGLGAGLWLGFAIRPVRATTLATYWQVPNRPGSPASPISAGDDRLVGAIRALAVVALAVVIVAGVLVGRDNYIRGGTIDGGTSVGGPPPATELRSS